MTGVILIVAVLAIVLWAGERMVKAANTVHCGACQMRVPKNATRCGHCGEALA